MMRIPNSLVAFSLFAAMYASGQSGFYAAYEVFTLGGGLNDAIEYSAPLTDGGKAVYGLFRSQVDFNPSGDASLRNALGNPDLFLARYDAQGLLQWHLGLGRLAMIDGMATGGLCTDSQMNIYIAGAFSSNVNFNPLGEPDIRTAVAGRDAFVACYSPSGILLWFRTFGNVNFVSTTALTCDQAGNVYAGIRFAGQIDIDPGPDEILLQSTGIFDAALVKFNSAGDYLWHRHISTAGGDEVSAITLSGNGLIGAGGYVNATTGVLPEFELYFTLMQEDGAEVFTHFLGNQGISNRVRSVAFHPSGNLVYFGGEIQAPTDFDPSPSEAIVSPLFRDIYVACYTTSGQFQWVQSPRSAGTNDFLAGIVVDELLLHIFGSFDISIRFDPDWVWSEYASAGARDVFAAVYKSFTGIWTGADVFGGTGDEFAQHALQFDDGIVVLSGYFTSSIAILDEVLSAGGRDGFNAWIEFPWGYVNHTGQIAEREPKFYPIPVQEVLYIEIPATGAWQLQLFDLTGRLVASSQGLGIGLPTPVNVRHLPKGLYIATLTQGAHTYSQKIVKH